MNRDQSINSGEPEHFHAASHNAGDAVEATLPPFKRSPESQRALARCQWRDCLNLIEEGNLQAALSFGNRALDLLAQLGADSAKQQINVRCQLAEICVPLSRYAHAEEHLTAAIDLAHTTSDIDGQALAAMYTKLGDVELALQEPQPGINAYQQAIDILTTEETPNLVKTVNVMLKLSEAYRSAGREADANYQLCRTYQYLAGHLSILHVLDSTRALSEIAGACLANRLYTEAEFALQGAVDLLKFAPSKPKAFETALLLGLGHAQFALGKFDQAYDNLSNALNITKQGGGHSWEQLTAIRKQMAKVRYAQGHADIAENVTRAILNDAARQFGGRSLEVVPFLIDTAVICYNNDAITEARDMAEKALKLTAQSAGPEVLEALDFEIDDFAEFVPFILGKNRGTERSRMVNVMLQLQRSYDILSACAISLGELDCAEKLILKHSAIADAMPTIEMGSSMKEVRLGMLRSIQGELDEAVTLFDQAVERYSLLRPEGRHPSYAELLRARGLTRLQQADYDQALSDLERAFKIAKGIPSCLKSAEFSHFLIGMGKYHQAVGEYVEAVHYLEKARDLLTKYGRSEVAQMRVVLVCLAEAYDTTGNIGESERCRAQSERIAESLNRLNDFRLFDDFSGR